MTAAERRIRSMAAMAPLTGFYMDDGLSCTTTVYAWLMEAIRASDITSRVRVAA